MGLLRRSEESGDSRAVFQGAQPVAAHPKAREHLLWVGQEALEQRRVPDPALPPRLLQHRSAEHTSELQSRQYLVCRLLLEKKIITRTLHKTIPANLPPVIAGSRQFSPADQPMVLLALPTLSTVDAHVRTPATTISRMQSSA